MRVEPGGQRDLGIPMLGPAAIRGMDSRLPRKHFLEERDTQHVTQFRKDGPGIGLKVPGINDGGNFTRGTSDGFNQRFLLGKSSIPKRVVCDEFSKLGHHIMRVTD